MALLAAADMQEWAAEADTDMSEQIRELVEVMAVLFLIAIVVSAAMLYHHSETKP